MSVLDELITHSRERAKTARVPQGQPAPRPSFRDAIAGKESLAVIAEFKRSSPSEGAIATECALADQITMYRDRGAAALSVLTEPSRFSGSLDDVRDAARTAALPILRKDFTVAAIQVAEAAHAGASAVLLIVRCLSQHELVGLAAVAREYGLDALVECHDASELDRALAIDGAIIGVNNRDLDTLGVDTGRALELLPRIPAGRVAVAESGYSDRASLAGLDGLADAILAGTALMRGPDGLLPGAGA